MSQLDQRDACHTLEKSKEKVDLDRLSHHHYEDRAKKLVIVSSLFSCRFFSLVLKFILIKK